MQTGLLVAPACEVPNSREVPKIEMSARAAVGRIVEIFINAAPLRAREASEYQRPSRYPRAGSTVPSARNLTMNKRAIS
jgi:hypothetical protein